MITYLIGDATNPVKKPAIIAHVCNNKGGYGRGFALAVANKWPTAQMAYRRLGKWPLGLNQLVHVGPSLFVANMIAQNGIRSNMTRPDTCLVDFHNLEKCLSELRTNAKMYNASVHLPRICMGLAGCKDWKEVEMRIKKHLDTVEVFIYDLPGVAS